ncbi:iron chelate uptake ABC transporter family permease subunit [Nocardia puris]|uniref:iron chelate uptake ABC transporter family permease subunit n=1 Tax=Nocardia puris TaxID=208602 RepID=UPI001F18F54E|nr:iron chelate uptake ABC transporter family permease subunit [Nocardia puris]
MITAMVGVVALGASTTDTPGLGFVEVIRVLTGQIGGTPANHVATWLPVVVTAALGGASLALSGAIFQTITRNPLGSPDIIGFTTGANTGALVAMLVLGLGSGGATLGALVGCLLTALVAPARDGPGRPSTLGRHPEIPVVRPGPNHPSAGERHPLEFTRSHPRYASISF